MKEPSKLLAVIFCLIMASYSQINYAVGPKLESLLDKEGTLHLDRTVYGDDKPELCITIPLAKKIAAALLAGGVKRIVIDPCGYRPYSDGDDDHADDEEEEFTIITNALRNTTTPIECIINGKDFGPRNGKELAEVFYFLYGCELLVNGSNFDGSYLLWGNDMPDLIDFRLECVLNALNALAKIKAGDSSGINSDIYQWVLKGAQNLQKIRCVEFSDKNNTDLKIFVKFIKKNNLVKGLRLVDVFFKEPTTVVGLAKALEEDTTLTEFEIDYSQCSDYAEKGGAIGKDYASFAGVLRKNTSLKKLVFSKVGLTDQDIDALATAIQDNKTMETLLITKNSLTKEQVLRFLNGLQENSTLKNLQLDLGYMHANKLEEIAIAVKKKMEDTREIAIALEKNNVIINFGIDTPEIFSQPINAILERNRMLAQPLLTVEPRLIEQISEVQKDIDKLLNGIPTTKDYSTPIPIIQPQQVSQQTQPQPQSLPPASIQNSTAASITENAIGDSQPSSTTAASSTTQFSTLSNDHKSANKLPIYHSTSAEADSGQDIVEAITNGGCTKIQGKILDMLNPLSQISQQSDDDKRTYLDNLSHEIDNCANLGSQQKMEFMTSVQMLYSYLAQKAIVHNDNFIKKAAFFEDCNKELEHTNKYLPRIPYASRDGSDRQIPLDKGFPASKSWRTPTQHFSVVEASD